MRKSPAANSSITSVSRRRNKCTCRWHSRYQGQRGPCKHILAVRMKVEGADNLTVAESEGTTWELEE